jgi:hypothetical protein
MPMPMPMPLRDATPELTHGGAESRRAALGDS